MSLETSEWLNTMTLIGFTEKRGKAWHYRKPEEGSEPNHYAGAIPVDDVLRRLFNFKAMSKPNGFQLDDGSWKLNGRQSIVTSDDFTELGVFKEGYTIHQYDDWLLNNVATILDADLGIGSAGLLKKRGQAWVQVEMPDSITTPEGVEFRPQLLACTSLDGSIVTTYKGTIGIVVCDNTLHAARGEKGHTYKIKHSKYSNFNIKDARDALHIVYKMADEFSEEVRRLTDWGITEADFAKLLDVTVPIPEKEGRGQTTATNKRNQLINLYTTDERAAPWKGTAFGVLQAYNTWNHHYSKVTKGAPRIIRNMENVVMGAYAKADTEILTQLATITG